MDFQQFITEQKKTHAPWCKYEELNDVALVVLLSTFWVLRLWCALRILCASGLSLKKAYDEAHRIATKLTPEGLNRLYTIHPHETPLTLLVFWGCNMNDISTELTKRTERYPLSREIIRYKMRKPGAPWMISLLKLAEADVKLGNYSHAREMLLQYSLVSPPTTESKILHEQLDKRTG